MKFCFIGEVTAEELRQRLDGAKERLSSQPSTEQHSQTSESGEQQSSSGEGEERGAGGRRGAGRKDFFPIFLIFPDLAFVMFCFVMLSPKVTFELNGSVV